MADDGERKEKVAAGLKKLKQFQQRTTKKPHKKKSSESKVAAGERALESNLESNNVLEQEPLEKRFHPDSIREAKPSAAHSLNDLSQLKDSNQQGTRVLSSAESLRQITLQLNGLMTESDAAINGETYSVSKSYEDRKQAESLLKRNRELATSLESFQQTNDQLEFQLQEFKAKLSRQQREFEREQKETEERAHREQTALKDQLQVHIQTIGILVAEKTELQSSLSQSQQTAKQKAVEAEEFQGRLKASRHRIGDLERELANLSSSSQMHEKTSKEYSKEVDRLKLESYKSNKLVEELKQEVAELSDKLNKKVKEHEGVQAELSDAKNQLSISQLYIQQLSDTDSVEVRNQLEQLHQDKLHLEKKVNEYKESSQQLLNEKQQMTDQYQLYVRQLTQQVESLKEELNKVTKEKEGLVKDKDELASNLSNASQAGQTVEFDDSEWRNRVEDLEKELCQIKQQYGTQLSDNSQMSHIIAEQESKIEELERTLSRIQDEQIDSTKLLDRIQSDKVAASRALAQNRELKKQLEELQDMFVKLSNDKLELTEKLHNEQHVTKELGERLGQQEEELKELRDQVNEKESKVRDLEDLTAKEMYQQNQLADRIRHYQAQCQLTEMLQQELNQAQERVSALVTQNADLRKSFAEKVQTAVDGPDNVKDSSKVNDMVASLSASVHQLELERDQLLRQLEEQRNQREAIKGQLREIKENQVAGQTSQEEEEISKDAYLNLKVSMKHLEERFKKTMDQIAELSDQKQQLEHLVTQLQGETDTIADYIALYQVQRGIMRKRAAEKDDYIAQLAKDREDLKAKLAELQALIVKLLEERQQPHVGPLPGKVMNLSSIVGDGPAEKPSEGCTHVTDAQPKSLPNGKDEDHDDITAKKIMNLLTEIETSNVIEPPVPESFHPCLVCSGRLLTV